VPIKARAFAPVVTMVVMMIMSRSIFYDSDLRLLSLIDHTYTPAAVDGIDRKCKLHELFPCSPLARGVWKERGRVEVGF
jgi:hypothetical protein